jgi:hypothetical protein
MEKVLTVEDFKAWGRAGGLRRCAILGVDGVKKAAIKAGKASAKARRQRSLKTQSVSNR